MGNGMTRGGACLVAATTLAVLGGCSNTATINYDQAANCAVFDQDPTGTPHDTLGAGGIFMLYRITSIDNTKSQAADFHFQVGKLSAGGANAQATSFLGPLVKTATDQVIPKGQLVQNIGWTVVDFPTTNPSADKTSSAALNYSAGANESVLPVNTAASSKPAFLDPCTPANIQKLK